ncbi:MAG: UBP-type zinc finger domain-containing protein [Chloroflexota bacterium]
MQQDKTPPCSHLATVTELPEPASHECAECIASGDSWVHLRMCLECGHVGCCDSSRNKHATTHNQGAAHPVVRSIERGERWAWCYEDSETLEL